MRPSRTIDPRVLALGTLLCACTTRGGEAPTPTPAAAPVSVATPPAPGVAIPSGLARPFVFLRPSPGGQAEPWLPGEPPRGLGVSVDFGGSTDSVGGVSPRLSPDGQWLAHRNGATLTLRRLDGTREEIVAQHPADRVELLLSGWTPDGQALLFHLGEAEAGEGLPRGVEAGFYRVRVADLKPTRVVGLAGFDAWLPDGGAVVYQRERGDGERTALMRAELAPGTKPTLLHEVGGSPGFDQLTLRGDEIVYVNDQALVRSKLDGSGRDELTARGEFAQYQRPRRSPDGTRVAYLDERTIKVIALGEMATRATRVTMTVCEVRRCEYAWESDAALLVVDSGGLWRIGLDGAASRIADRVLGLAVAGE